MQLNPYNKKACSGSKRSTAWRQTFFRCPKRTNRLCCCSIAPTFAQHRQGPRVGTCAHLQPYNFSPHKRTADQSSATHTKGKASTLRQHKEGREGEKSGARSRDTRITCLQGQGKKNEHQEVAGGASAGMGCDATCPTTKGSQMKEQTEEKEEGNTTLTDQA